MTVYSTSKALWHTDRIESLRRGRVPAPVHVQLVLSDLCNHDCSFCAYRISEGLSTELFVTPETHNPNRRMATPKALEIIDCCADIGVRAIQFTGGGEPTVHPDHLALIEHAQSRGLDTALVTNGVRLDPTHPATLALKWIRVSVDAGTPETYARVRRVTTAHWDRAWGVLRALSETYQGRLSVGFVVTNENHTELSDFVRQCHRSGVRSARVGAVFSEKGAAYYTKVSAVTQSIDAARGVASAVGVELANLFPRRIDDLQHGAPTDAFCGYQHFTMYVGADLGVYRCCNTAYTTRGKVGDLTNQTLSKLLASRAIADGFDARQCHYCQFTEHNKTISALMRKPDDANFV